MLEIEQILLALFLNIIRIEEDTSFEAMYPLHIDGDSMLFCNQISERFIPFTQHTDFGAIAKLLNQDV